MFNREVEHYFSMYNIDMLIIMIKYNEDCNKFGLNNLESLIDFCYISGEEFKICNPSRQSK